MIRKMFFHSMVIIGFLLVCSCQGKVGKTGEDPAYRTARGKVEVMYFHNEQRCLTCESVEINARDAVAEMENVNVVFSIYSLSDRNARELADSIGIAGQTLIIIGHRESFNITTEAFIIAQTKPEQLKSYIIEKIEEAI